MDLDRIPVIGMLVRRMEFLGARQRVIAQNVANADTPGYQARDLAPESFARHVAAQSGSSAASASAGLAVTATGHLGGTIEPNRGTALQARADDFETTPSGNAVVLEEEMARLAETKMDYDTITGIYRKQVSMLKTALGRGQSG
jgi:flagellar basal-body rod protein FlgB